MEELKMARRLKNRNIRRNIRRKINTLKWVTTQKIRSYINNNILGIIGLFLTNNNRISQILGHTDLFDGEYIRQISGIDWSDEIESGMVMRDLATRKIWILQGWNWEV